MLTEKEVEVLRRRAAGESQQQIAHILNISQAAVSKFETNAHRKIVEADRLLEVAQGLGLSLGDGLAGKRVLYQGKPNKADARKGGGRA